MKIEYGIVIKFNRQVPDVFNSDSATTDTWALSTSTGEYNYNGIAHKGGYLSKNKLGKISRRIDISNGGKYAYDNNSFSFSIRNGGSAGDNYSIFSNDVLNGYQINPKGAKITVSVGFEGDYRELWSGYIDNLSVDDNYVTFGCKTDNKIIHTAIPSEEFNESKFPYIADSLVSKTMPEVIGWCPRAKLYPTQNKREIVRNLFTNADVHDYYDDQHREIPITAAPIKAISSNGTTIVVFRGRTGDALAEFNDKTGYSIDVMMGGASGESRKIIKNYVLQKDSEIYTWGPRPQGNMGSDTDNYGFEYEAFVLETPLDIDDVVVGDNKYILTTERLERMKDDAFEGADYMTEYGINFWKYLAANSDDDPDVNDIAGFDPTWNRCYQIPWNGDIYDHLTDDVLIPTQRIKNNETLTDYMETDSDGVFGMHVNSTGVTSTPPNGSTYIVLPNDMSYICVTKYRGDLVVSTNTITNVAYKDTYFGSDELIYHDEDFGEMPMNEIVVDRNNLRQDSEYPKITIEKEAVDDESTDMSMADYLSPSKIVLTDSTYIDTPNGSSIIPVIGADLADCRTRDFDKKVKLAHINSGPNITRITTQTYTANASIEFDVYFDDMSELAKYDKVSMGSRLTIAPDLYSSTPTKSAYGYISAAKVQVFAVDHGGTALHGGTEAMFYSAAAVYDIEDPNERVDQGSTSDLFTESETVKGLYTLEGLSSKFFTTLPDIVQDTSAASTDISNLASIVDVEDVIKCFRVRIDLSLNSNATGFGWYPNGNPWSIWLNTIGFKAVKVMDSSRLVTNCQGIIKMNGIGGDINPTPPRVIRSMLRIADGIAYDSDSFMEAYEYFKTETPSYFGSDIKYMAIGQQVQKSTATYDLYNDICENSMIAMWLNRDNVMQCKYWLGDIDTTPSITHNQNNIISGTVDIQPNVYGSVHTEYDFMYAYDPVLDEYRKEFHIRNTNQSEFPADGLKEASAVLLSSSGLPAYISAVRFVAAYSAYSKRIDGIEGFAQIEMQTIKGIDLDDLKIIGLDIGYNIVVTTDDGVEKQLRIDRILKTSTGYKIRCRQAAASDELVDLDTTQFTVRSTSTDYIWTRWCNATIDGELSYAKSKQYWDAVHKIYEFTGIISKAPTDYTELSWVHEEFTFNAFLDRYLYWTGFLKYVPTYKLALTSENLDEIELLNYVTWEDSVHTKYTKHELNDDGTPTGNVSVISERKGWITDYTFDLNANTIEVKLILDKEKSTPTIIDENTNPEVEETIDENANNGTNSFDENETF